MGDERIEVGKGGLGGRLGVGLGVSQVDQERVGSLQSGNPEQNQSNQKSRLKVTIK